MITRRLLSVVIGTVLCLLLARPVVPAQARSSPLVPLPASALAAVPMEHSITNLVITPSTPSIVKSGEMVNYDLTYTTSEAGGVRINLVPYTNGSPTPGSLISASPLYPTGTGAASGSFTVSSGPVVIDHLHIEILTADSSTVLQTYSLPVHYEFSDGENLVFNMIKSPPLPNLLRNDQALRIDYSYEIAQTGGALIHVTPYSGDAVTPGFSPSMPAPVSGPGNATALIQIPSGSVLIDRINFQITTTDETILLAEYNLPVWAMFVDEDSNASRVMLSLHSPNIYPAGDDVSISFDYATNQPSVQVVIQPYSAGQPVADSVAVSDPLGMSASGTGTATLNIDADVTVTALLVQVIQTVNNQPVLLWEQMVPVHYQFGRGSHPVFLPFISR